MPAGERLGPPGTNASIPEWTEAQQWARSEEVEATWAKEYDTDGEATGGGGSTGIPVYVAEVQVTGYPLAPSTGPLRCTDDLRAQVLDDAERPLAKCPYKVILQSGRVLSGETDGEGTLEHTARPACTRSCRWGPARNRRGRGRLRSEKTAA